jgi:hypothetical protein
VVVSVVVVGVVEVVVVCVDDVVVDGGVDVVVDGGVDVLFVDVAGVVDWPPPCVELVDVLGCFVIARPVGESTYHFAPNAVTACPAASVASRSPTKK